MDTTNPILGNPLLLAAILLLLAILPRALRQNKKTALDKAVERFEREEMKAAAEGKTNEDKDRQKKPIPLKDGSLAYLKENPSAAQIPEENKGIPPFPVQEEGEKERVKVVKPGVPISHFETAEPPPKKKVKLIKQEFSIAPDKNKTRSKKIPSDPVEKEQPKSPTNEQESTWNEDLPVPPISNTEEDSWIEAEIPGLTIEPPAEEPSEDIPVFNASPKEEYLPEPEKSQEPSPEKQSAEVKNMAPKTEEKKGSKSEKQEIIMTDSPQLEMEIQESEPKEVEIKAPVVSHKNIAEIETVSEEAGTPSSKASETEGEITAAPPEQENLKTTPETAKLKPFLLDLRYLDQEGSETENLISQEVLPADMVDATITRLNALQADLENQLVSTPGNVVSGDALVNENMRKKRTRDSLPDLEGTINTSSGKKEVSLEELDSFLFTASQKKNK